MPSRPRTRPNFAKPLGVTAVLACAGLAHAGGALDVEIPNRAKVRSSFEAPRELDTYRLRIPAGAELDLVLKGSKRGAAPRLRVFDPTGQEVPLAGSLSTTRTGVKLKDLPLPLGGLYQLDVEATGERTGKYVLSTSWSLPATLEFGGQVPAEGAGVPFRAEAGSKAKFDLRTALPGVTVQLVAVEGPGGFRIDFPPPSKARSRQKEKRHVLPSTGSYRLVFGASLEDAAVTGAIKVKAPRGKRKLDLRAAENRGVGVSRFVTRMLDAQGGSLDVPNLSDFQLVALDASGARLDIPTGALPSSTTMSLRTSDGVIGNEEGFGPAGVLLDFDAEGRQFAEPAVVTLPYDAGAFPEGAQGELCVLKLTDDGEVVQVPPGQLDVDEGAGTVSFPTSGFSSFQAFSPPVELAVVAEPGRPNDLSVPPDENVLFLSTDLLSRDNPAAAVLRLVPGQEPQLFAGGGGSTADLAHRLAFDFDRDVGFTEGVIVSAIHAGPGGQLVVVTGDRSLGASVVYVIDGQDRVLRVAGDGTADLDEDQPARLTGLPFCCAATLDVDGNVLVVTDGLAFPQSDRVLKIFTGFADPDRIRITTVAGGGTVDVSGAHPLDTRLTLPRAVLTDAQGRILVGDRDWLLRFDLTAGTTETLAGTNFGEFDEDGGEGERLGGIGAPLRTVVLGDLDDLAFAPGTEDILYAADPSSGIVWRFDLRRDRAFVAAGRRPGFDVNLETREPDPALADPTEPLNFPVAVAPLGGDVFIAELFRGELLSLRRRNR